jgi:predicted site-specific integrase-resolvase
MRPKHGTTPNDVAARNGVSPTIIYREIKAGRLVARKLGARTIITADDERAWIDALPRFGLPEAATA